MSKPYSYEPQEKTTSNSSYLGDATARDMRPIHEDEENPENEAQTIEDAEEGWQQKNPSPVAGRMVGSMEELEHIQSSEMMTSQEVQQCIKDSLDCYQTCTNTIVHCLNLKGKHSEPKHINLLMDCTRICSLNADFMLRNSTYYPQTCGICADICDECADDCDRFEEDFMKECASVCRRCAESCREMAR